MSDLISRADAIAYIDRIINSGLGRNKSLDYIHKYISLLPSADAVSCEAIMSAKFHPLPYTHITPTDAEAESYKRGWNDALDAVVDNAPSADAVHIETYRELYEKYVNLKHASADAVQGWRTDKPTKQGEYIVTVDSMRHGMVELMYYGKPMMPNRKVRGKCWYRSDDEWGDVVYDDKDILAWMPLPKPYRKDGEA